jgi:hypothetical protein
MYQALWQPFAIMNSSSRTLTRVGPSFPVGKQQCLSRITLSGNQGRLRWPPQAARTAGPPEGAAAPMNQSREAHRSAWPLHSPEGGWSAAGFAADQPHEGHHQPERRSRRRGGTRVVGVESSVGFRVGSSVGANRLGHDGTRPGPAGLRSLPAKQHAPKARPSAATDRGRHGVVPGQAVKGEWLRRESRLAAGCRTFALDRQAARPSASPALPRSCGQ